MAEKDGAVVSQPLDAYHEALAVARAELAERVAEMKQTESCIRRLKAAINALEAQLGVPSVKAW